MNHSQKIKSFLTFEAPYALSFDGWDEWNAKTKAEQPIKWFFLKTIPDVWKTTVYWKLEHIVVRQLYWGFKYRFIPKHQYNIVKPRTLSPDYHNPYSVLLHASFEVLVNFIEFERDHGYVDWMATTQHSEFWYEANKLMYWWQNIRPCREDWLDRDYPYPDAPKDCEKTSWVISSKYTDTPEYKEFSRICKIRSDLELQYEEEETTNLKRLADIRMFLWN